MQPADAVKSSNSSVGTKIRSLSLGHEVTGLGWISGVFRHYQKSQKIPLAEWQVFEGLATLHYMRTLIFGTFSPSRGVCDLWKAAGLTSVLDLQAQFHSFSTISSAVQRGASSMALSLLLYHETSNRHEPYSAPFRAAGPNPLGGGEHLCASSSALTRSQGRGWSLFLAMGKVGDPMGFPHLYFQATLSFS